MTRVVVIGDLMTDTVARAASPLVKGSDTPASVTMHGGGSGANVAAWLAVEGGDVAFIGRRGTDIAGRNRDMELMGYGVDARLVMDPDGHTGTCVVMVTHRGDHTKLSDPGANASLSPDDLPQDLFLPGGHLHVSGYTLINEGSRSAGLTALGYARNQRMTASIDGASVAPIERVGPEAFLQWTAGVKLCFVNADQAEALTGLSEPDDAARVLSQHYQQVVVKLGPQGALWLGAGSGDPVHTPAESVQVIDGTGAGDAFCAGFLGSWLAGKAPTDALASGCHLASKALGTVGARPPL